MKHNNTLKLKSSTKNSDVYTNVHTIVVCAGWRSKEIARMCGDGDIPLIAERGYSVEFPDTEQVSPSKLLTRATCFQRGGFILSPLQSRLRVAGLVEFGPNQPPTASNFLLLETTTHNSSGTSRKRPPPLAIHPPIGSVPPNLPDYLPVIGRSAAKTNVVYAFGHQHVGFTLAGITGKIVADIADETPLEFSLEPYGLARFFMTRCYGNDGDGDDDDDDAVACCCSASAACVREA